MTKLGTLLKSMSKFSTVLLGVCKPATTLAPSTPSVVSLEENRVLREQLGWMLRFIDDQRRRTYDPGAIATGESSHTDYLDSYFAPMSGLPKGEVGHSAQLTLAPIAAGLFALVAG